MESPGQPQKKHLKRRWLLIVVAITGVAAVTLLGVLLHHLKYRRTFGFTITSPYWVHPDKILRAAGYVPATAKRFKPERDTDLDDRDVWEFRYEFKGRTVTLSLDSKTSQLVEIDAYPFKGSTTTGTVANLTPEWARQKLLDLNVWQVRQETFHTAGPIIEFDPWSLDYSVIFPRTDAHGHLFGGYQFRSNAASFSFDVATSRVLDLQTGPDLPEPAVTTGTMISRDEATSIALQWHLDHLPGYFKHAPEKMTFDYAPEPTVVRVVESELTTGTVVAYVIGKFKSRLTDPSYEGRYPRITTVTHVDAFTGEIVGGHIWRMWMGGR